MAAELKSWKDFHWRRMGFPQTMTEMYCHQYLELMKAGWNPVVEMWRITHTTSSLAKANRHIMMYRITIYMKKLNIFQYWRWMGWLHYNVSWRNAMMTHSSITSSSWKHHALLYYQRNCDNGICRSNYRLRSWSSTRCDIHLMHRRALVSNRASAVTMASDN